MNLNSILGPVFVAGVISKKLPGVAARTFSHTKVPVKPFGISRDVFEKSNSLVDSEVVRQVKYELAQKNIEPMAFIPTNTMRRLKHETVQTPLPVAVKEAPQILGRNDLTKLNYKHELKDKVRQAIQEGKIIHDPYTGKELTETDLTIEHLLPNSKGGPVTYSNIVITAQEPNGRRGNINFKEVPKIFPHLEENLGQYFQDLHTNKVVENQHIHEPIQTIHKLLGNKKLSSFPEITQIEADKNLSQIGHGNHKHVHRKHGHHKHSHKF